MVSTHLRVLILQSEYERILDYVARVPHRSTGGILRGIRFTQGQDEFLAVTATAATVPDELLADETCADHPYFTLRDALDTGQVQSMNFLGRWHSHTDGLNRPSAADLEWSLPFLQAPELALDALLHPIVTAQGGEIKIAPYLVTRDSQRFQIIHWQVVTAPEFEQLRSGSQRAAVALRAVDSQIFSMAKVRDLLREEQRTVAEMPDVIRCELVERGSQAVLEIKISSGGAVAELQITANSLYPVHAPRIALVIDELVSSFVPPSLNEWTSACKAADLVAEVTRYLQTPAQVEEPSPSAPDPNEVKVVARSPAAFFLYFLLLVSISAGSYVWYAGLWPESWGGQATSSPTPSGAVTTVSAPDEHLPQTPPPMQLPEKASVLVVLVDCGPKVNLSEAEARWGFETALDKNKVELIRVDLNDPTKDLEHVHAQLAHRAALFYLCHEAGPKQSAFVTALRSLGLPVGVLSTRAGSAEADLRQNVAFYRLLPAPADREILQRMLLDLRTSHVLEIGVPKTSATATPQSGGPKQSLAAPGSAPSSAATPFPAATPALGATPVPGATAGAAGSPQAEASASPQGAPAPDNTNAPGSL